uniref:Uncharacterized protein n=1 Tax=Marseillevirus sp. TaxID=2809551 RepID=A0AA96ERX3_9VIRU|nr:hypothetical protein MarFTMF_401 [Marseillevirus sp.]
MSLNVPGKPELQYLHVMNILSERAWMDDVKFLGEHWRNDPQERLFEILHQVFEIKEFGGEIRKECRDPETRRLYHIVAEALDLFHASATDWNMPNTGRDESCDCKPCSIRRSARENITSGIVVSSRPLDMRKRDIKHRNKAFQRNFDAARLMGKRWVTRPKKHWNF